MQIHNQVKEGVVASVWVPMWNESAEEAFNRAVGADDQLMRCSTYHESDRVRLLPFSSPFLLNASSDGHELGCIPIFLAVS